MEAAAKGPTLREVEVNIGTWHYTLGKLATDQLVEGAGGDSPLEFYRLLAPQRHQDAGRWTSYIGWQTAFLKAFGVPVSEFYERFDSWQEALPGRVVWAGFGDGARRLAGRLVREDGTPIVGAKVIAGVGGTLGGAGHDYGESIARTEADGSWQLAVSSNRRVQLRAELAEQRHSHLRCTVHWRMGGATWDYAEADWIDIGTSDPERVEFALPDDWCARRISGRITDESGNGIEGLEVVAGSRITPHELNGPRVLTQLDGTYEIVVPRAIEYRVTVRTESLVRATGCEIHYSRSGATISRGHASSVDVTLRDAPGVNIPLRYDMCFLKVTGVLMDADDMAIAGAAIRLQTDSTIVSYRTDAAGQFELTVPEPGEWQVSINLDGCIVYYAAGGTSASATDASTLILLERTGGCRLR